MAAGNPQFLMVKGILERECKGVTVREIRIGRKR
jgi:hypothetical protein